MIRRELYDAYTSGLDLQYAEASRMLMDYIDSMDWGLGYEATKAQRDQVIEFAYSLIEVYGGNAAVLASDFYGQVALEAGKSILETTLADMPRMGSVAASIRAAARFLWGLDRDADAFRAACVASLKRYVKQCADATMEANAMRDGGRGARWARVPRGPETCAFCIMVASRGFVYASEQSARFFGHSHEHCDCDVICGFDGEGLEGYDPDEWLAIYDANLAYDRYGHIAGGTKGVVNSIRRGLYEEHAGKYREQHRRWYARNAESERERQAAYREQHRDEINARRRRKRADAEAAVERQREIAEKARWLETYRNAVDQQRELGI